jgi:ornithine cyclodeaminase/alanine dehydrogenase
MQKNQLLYLSKTDVAAVGLTMVEIIESLEITFRAKGEGRTEMPPKPSIHPGGKDNFMNAMLAYIPDLKSAGIKWVSGFPENPKRGLPYIAGPGLLPSVPVPPPPYPPAIWPVPNHL